MHAAAMHRWAVAPRQDSPALSPWKATAEKAGVKASKGREGLKRPKDCLFPSVLSFRSFFSELLKKYTASKTLKTNTTP